MAAIVSLNVELWDTRELAHLGEYRGVQLLLLVSGVGGGQVSNIQLEARAAEAWTCDRIGALSALVPVSQLGSQLLQYITSSRFIRLHD